MLGSSRNSNSDIALVGTAGAVAAIFAVQFFTEADPIGRCLLFFKQLGSHVRIVPHSYTLVAVASLLFVGVKKRLYVLLYCCYLLLSIIGETPVVCGFGKKEH